MIPASCLRRAADGEGREAVEVPSEAQHLIRRGAAAFAGGRYAEAEGLLRKAIDRGGGFASVYNMLGLIAGYRGSASEAAELFGQALTLNPEYREARINLTICLAEMGAGDQAAEEATRLQAGEPKEPGGPDRAAVGALANAHADLASKYHALGMFAEAVGEYDKALALCPHFPDLHLRRAASCREQGDHAGAMASLRRTLELKPDYAEALVNLGLLHQMMGNRAEAIAAWERALALDPTHSLARIYLAQAPPRAAGG